MLGEGRLTDALGRTADFGNAIIIMTSNLGARQARASLGLRPAMHSDRATYVAAAERFFRPEFFNRIDRLVPFERLTRDEIAGIAHRLIAQLLQRDGLVHRRCVLAVDPSAMERVIDQGFHPDLGARALKRSLERQLTQPVAARLAAVAPDAPALIHLLPAGDNIAVRIDTLTYAQRRPLAPPVLDLADWATVLDRIELVLNRVDDAVADLEPAGQLTQGELSAAHYRYLAVRELLEQLRRGVDRLDRLASTPPRRGMAVLPAFRTHRPSKKLLAMTDGDTRLALRAAADIASQMAAMESEPAEFGDALRDQLIELIGEAAMLDAIAGSPDDQARCLVWLRSPNVEADWELDSLILSYRSLFSERLGFAASIVPPASDPPYSRERALLVEMPGASALMLLEQGTHLFNGNDRKLTIVQAVVTALGDRDLIDVLAEFRAAERAWRQALRGGIEEPPAEPFPLLPVVRAYDKVGLTIDVRSGLAVRGLPSSAELRKFLLAQVPWPKEMES